jgi:TPR repeat protein
VAQAARTADELEAPSLLQAQPDDQDASHAAADALAHAADVPDALAPASADDVSVSEEPVPGALAADAPSLHASTDTPQVGAADAADAVPDAHPSHAAETGAPGEPSTVNAGLASERAADAHLTEASAAGANSEQPAPQTEQQIEQHAAPSAEHAPAATAQAPAVPSYADGQAIEVGDAVAIDGGFSGGRLQAVALDAAAPGGFAAALDVGGGRLQRFDGASFMQRAQRLGQDTLSYHAADGRVVEWLQARTAAGEARAQLYLGIRLLQGTGIDKDTKKAYEYLVLAADQNEALAQYLVGMMSKSPARSVRYWAAAAAQGHAPSQFCLGMAHLQGTGVPRDPQLARDWLARAAAQAHVPAIYNLGVLDHQPEAQLLQDPDIKLPRLQHMAEQGDAMAAWVLGRLALDKASPLDADHTATTVLDAARAGFAPAWRTLISLLGSDRLSDAVRDHVVQGLAQASDSLAADLGQGLIDTAAGHTAPALAAGVRHLQAAADAGFGGAMVQAKERLQALQVALLAHAPDWVAQAQAQAATGEGESAQALLPLLRANAQALQAMGEHPLVPLGPNGRMQTLALWDAAAHLGDEDAAQVLQQLQAHPDWAQVRVLDDLARHAYGQTESLSPVDEQDSNFWSTSKIGQDTERQSLDTGIDERTATTADQAEGEGSQHEGADFQAALDEEDLAALGAFKDMPSLQTLDAMGADAALIAPADEAPAADAPATPAEVASNASVAMSADAGQADGVNDQAPGLAQTASGAPDAPGALAPLQTEPPRRKPWWKFW